MQQLLKDYIHEIKLLANHKITLNGIHFKRIFLSNLKIELKPRNNEQVYELYYMK